MRQKWGQNFLVNEGVAKNIVDALRLRPTDAVLEIGPGKGMLTKYLVDRVQSFTMVELDSRLAGNLVRRWGASPGVTVVNQDFLEWPLPVLPDGAVKVMGNLPYSVGNAILRKFLDWNAWSVAVVMVQKEVADRIAAGPGNTDYGILSLAVQAKAAVETLCHVAPGSFRPPPKVTSTVLRLKRLPVARVADEKPFFDVVHAAFGQRRKTLLNSLAHGLDKDKAVIQDALEKAGIDPQRRAETVSLDEFKILTEKLV